LITEALRRVITVRVKITNKEWTEEFDDLANLGTSTFVEQIENAVIEEFKGSGITQVKVTSLRKGSVIADLQLTFSEPVGESEVAALLSDVVEDGKLGQFEVDEAPEGQY